jgi:hypothetical protein
MVSGRNLRERRDHEKNEICEAVNCRLIQCSSLLMERKRASGSFFDFERG